MLSSLLIQTMTFSLGEQYYGLWILWIIDFILIQSSTYLDLIVVDILDYPTWIYVVSLLKIWLDLVIRV